MTKEIPEWIYNIIEYYISTDRQEECANRIWIAVQQETKEKDEQIKGMRGVLEELIFQINNYDIVDRLNQYVENGCGDDFAQYVIKAKAAMNPPSSPE